MSVKNYASVDLNGHAVPMEIAEPGPVDIVYDEPSSKSVFEPVGHCIYCGSTQGLSDEHIIPYALSGDIVLPKASCTECARETCRFEQLVLRGPMRAARIYRQLKSRSRHEGGPETHRLVFVKDSGEEQVDLPLAECPLLLHFPMFAQPGCITGSSALGIQMQGINTVLFGPSPAEVARKNGAREVKFPPNKSQPIAFARMLAKIAYGFAFANGSTSQILGPSPVLQSIRGLTDDVGKWVFTDVGVTTKYHGQLHRVQLHELQGMLVAEVHLFADSETPKYGVVLGKLKDQ